MPSYQVTCISKPDRFSAHEHITHVGNLEQGWKITREDAIARIERSPNPDEFYVIDPRSGKKALVGVVRVSGKAPYLQTYADGIWTNNLLSLPQCPVR